MRFWAAAFVLAGCGRLGFDPSNDASPAPFRCATPPVPDSLTVSGKTFRYNSFDNLMIATLSATNVDLHFTDNGQIQGTASDAMGFYSMAFPFGSAPRPAYVAYTRTSFMPTYVFLDGLLGTDLIGPGNQLWLPGDGPLWNDTQMNMIYAAGNVTRSPNAGSVNVGVRDCMNNPIPGAQIVFDPSPGDVRYQDETGMPGAVLAETGTKFGHGFAFNPAIASTHVTAIKDGYRFTEATFDVTDGSNNLVLIHGGP